MGYLFSWLTIIRDMWGDPMDVKVESHIPEIKDAARDAVERALEAVGLQAEGYAKMLCPVDTGNLRNSITHTTEPSDRSAYIGTNVEYAPYVEYGTSRTKAQPFLQPAAEDHVEEYMAIFQQYLQGE